MNANLMLPDPLGLAATAGPLVLAALGGLVSEYAGLLNIGLEGFMLVGAFLAIVGAQATLTWGAGLMLGLGLALAGALLSISLGAFVPNQSSGQGWIALVLIFVGGRHPLGIAAAGLGFVVIEQLSLAAQAGQDHPALLVGLPYLLILGALLAVQLIQRLWRSTQR